MKCERISWGDADCWNTYNDKRENLEKAKVYILWNPTNSEHIQFILSIKYNVFNI